MAALVREVVRLRECRRSAFLGCIKMIALCCFGAVRFFWSAELELWVYLSFKVLLRLFLLGVPSWVLCLSQANSLLRIVHGFCLLLWFGLIVKNHILHYMRGGFSCFLDICGYRFLERWFAGKLKILGLWISGYIFGSLRVRVIYRAGRIHSLFLPSKKIKTSPLVMSASKGSSPS